MTNAANITALGYLAGAILFILSIRGLSGPETALKGLRLGVIGMMLAIGSAIFSVRHALDPQTIAMIATACAAGAAIGAVMATKAPMTLMPQMVSCLNGLGGLASLSIAVAAAFAPASFSLLVENEIAMRSRIEIAISAIIGAVTFSGSMMAALKLQGAIGIIAIPGRHVINALTALAALTIIAVFAVAGDNQYMLVAAIIAILLGVLLVMPIGGADMPVIVSMLNSCSGWAGAALGMTLDNFSLIVVGSLIGASGSILSYIMCKAMNRSLLAVIAGGFGTVTSAKSDFDADRPIRAGSAEDAAFVLKNATNIIIVPGYGMAVAQAQHAVKEMTDALKNTGAKISFAIHPVAGRMPGHMNVLLAEAQIPYDDIFTMEEINPSFKQADIAFVIGANDVTNPAAQENPTSPIYGMPVLEVWKADTVMFVKRSLRPGYSDTPNDLFYRDNTMMLLGDGRKMVENIVRAL